jgi:hypothetical protein
MDMNKARVSIHFTNQQNAVTVLRRFFKPPGIRVANTPQVLGSIPVHDHPAIMRSFKRVVKTEIINPIKPSMFFKQL